MGDTEYEMRTDLDKWPLEPGGFSFLVWPGNGKLNGDRTRAGRVPTTRRGIPIFWFSGISGAVNLTASFFADVLVLEKYARLVEAVVTFNRS